MWLCLTSGVYNGGGGGGGAGGGGGLPYARRTF